MANSCCDPMRLDGNKIILTRHYPVVLLVRIPETLCRHLTLTLIIFGRLEAFQFLASQNLHDLSLGLLPLQFPTNLILLSFMLI